jgi:hypothetical protein
MKRYLSACLLGACLLIPVVVKADDDNHQQNKRYYDRDAKDWHEWNGKEDQAYHRYLVEQHVASHDWTKANNKEQRDYFRWRHSHPDVVVVPDVH